MKQNCPPINAGSFEVLILTNDNIFSFLSVVHTLMYRARRHKRDRQHLMQELFVIGFPVIQTNDIAILSDSVADTSNPTRRSRR